MSNDNHQSKNTAQATIGVTPNVTSSANHGNVGTGGAGKMTERLLAVQVLYGIAMNPGRINNNIVDSLAGIKKIMGEELAIGSGGGDKNKHSLLLVETYQQQRNLIIDRVIDCLAGGEEKWQTLETILQIILCLGTAELMIKKQPPAVVISSWVEVTKSYFADQSPKLIHAVLDRINKKNPPSATAAS
ncbi:MAG: transcription antitermination factor NusB [Hydrotalea sp.]|nr:transcription antitermination factor NusB [Hydrotalea sp.]